MARIVVPVVCAAIGLISFGLTPLLAQTAAINDIKGKIFDAEMAEKLFAGGLSHCSELDGSNFYFQPRDRVLNLEDYHRSLDNLAAQGVFNPVTKRPWNQQDADARWQQVKQEAASDRTTCALVASLPELKKKLDELQRQSGDTQGSAAAGSK